MWHIFYCENSGEDSGPKTYFSRIRPPESFRWTRRCYILCFTSHPAEHSSLQSEIIVKASQHRLFINWTSSKILLSCRKQKPLCRRPTGHGAFGPCAQSVIQLFHLRRNKLTLSRTESFFSCLMLPNQWMLPYLPTKLVLLVIYFNVMQKSFNKQNEKCSGYFLCL